MSPDPASARDPRLDTAVAAVRKAGEIQLAHFERDVRIHAKGESDIVTDVNIEVETMFRAMIAERYPDHYVLGEELTTDGDAADRPVQWLFDPIDGTVNFARGVPFFCASLALEVRGVLELAAIYEPVRGELFTAVRGRGAQLNGRALHVSDTTQFRQAVFGTGFPHNATARSPQMENVLAESAILARAVRRLGSAALDLAYVAAGRVDAFWDRNLKPWDTAAGALIVAEAGGIVTDLDGRPFSCRRGGVLASNGRVHSALLDLIRRSASL